MFMGEGDWWGRWKQAEGFGSLAFSWEKVKIVTLEGGRSLESDRQRQLICRGYQPRPALVPHHKTSAHPCKHSRLRWSFPACTLPCRLSVVFLLFSLTSSWSLPCCLCLIERSPFPQLPGVLNFPRLPPLASGEEKQWCNSCHNR